MIRCFKRILISVLFAFILTDISAQIPSLDSLVNIMHTAKEEKISIDAANLFAYFFFLKTNNIDSAQKAVKLS